MWSVLIVALFLFHLLSAHHEDDHPLWRLSLDNPDPYMVASLAGGEETIVFEYQKDFSVLDWSPPADGSLVELVGADNYGCEASDYEGKDFVGKISLNAVSPGGDDPCSYSQKAEQAKTAGAVAIIMYDGDADDPNTIVEAVVSCFLFCNLQNTDILFTMLQYSNYPFLRTLPSTPARSAKRSYPCCGHIVFYRNQVAEQPRCGDRPQILFAGDSVENTEHYSPKHLRKSVIQNPFRSSLRCGTRVRYNAILIVIEFIYSMLVHEKMTRFRLYSESSKDLPE